MNAIIRILTLLVLSLLMYACSEEKKVDYGWMDEYDAIICLTYDDGMVTQYQNALPHLNQYNLKGTFYINNVSTREAVAAWRDASKAGHELGNHTLFHPCPKSLGWLEEVTTDYYTVDIMMDEIKTVNAILDLTEQEGKKRSFAYPCNNMFLGEESYKDDIANSDMITYARTGSQEKTILRKDDQRVDLMNVPSWAVAEGTQFAEMKEYVDKVLVQEGIGVIQFHGVGGEWLSVSNEDHLELIEYLSDRKDRILVTTFSVAMGYLESQRG